MAGSRLNIKNYDIKYKMDVCEEYLTLIKDNPSISKRNFALERGLKPTTFQDWIRSYIAYKNNNDNGDDGVIATTNKITPLPKFIQISQEEDKPVNNNSASKITLRYKDVSIEFDNDVDSLEKVLGIIKRW